MSLYLIYETIFYKHCLIRATCESCHPSNRSEEIWGVPPKTSRLVVCVREGSRAVRPACAGGRCCVGGQFGALDEDYTRAGVRSRTRTHLHRSKLRNSTHFRENQQRPPGLRRGASLFEKSWSIPKALRSAVARRSSLVAEFLLSIPK